MCILSLLFDVDHKVLLKTIKRLQNHCVVERHWLAALDVENHYHNYEYNFVYGLLQ